MIPDAIALGQWVKQAREQAGMSQEELGDQARCGKAYISKVEKATPHSIGKRAPTPTLKFLHNLSKALGTSIATPLAKLGYLRAEADMEVPAHPIRILHYYNGLTKEDQAVAEAMVKTLYMARQRQDKETEKPKAKPKSSKRKTA